MAAVSTNYGTAGDSHLESGAYASRTPKNGSSAKTGSGSGSGSGADSAARTKATGTTDGTLVSVSREESRAWDRLRSEKGFLKTHARLRSESVGGSRGGVGTVAEDDAIEMVDRGGMGSAGSDGSTRRMFIRKDVQYSVEYKRKRSEGEVHSETEYWDRYLDQQRY